MPSKFYDCMVWRILLAKGVLMKVGDIVQYESNRMGVIIDIRRCLFNEICDVKLFDGCIVHVFREFIKVVS